MPCFTTIDEQSTFQNNSLTDVTDTIIPSLSNLPNQIKDLISDESIQKGFVPYKTDSGSESDYENYPEKNNKTQRKARKARKARNVFKFKNQIVLLKETEG